MKIDTLGKLRDEGDFAFDPVLKFGFLWQAAPHPDLVAFVAQSVSISIDQLGCIIRLDLRHGWAAGEPVPIDWYFDQFPQLETDPSTAVDVIYAEYLQRERYGPVPTADEYARRFPQFAAELRHQIEFHDLMSGPIVPQETETEPVLDVTPAIEKETLRLTGDTHDGTNPPGDLPVETTIARGSSVDSATRQPHVAGYQIVGQLGRGGFGVVYKAMDLQLKRTVALKMLLAGAHASDHQIRRFQSEAEAAARLRHPGIAQVHEVGECEGHLYLSMEFIDGVSLSTYCQGRPQPARWSATLMEQVARAVDFAHRHGIVHRDLKPANVLLQSDDMNGSSDDMRNAEQDRSAENTFRTPKIIDFGLAKLRTSDSREAAAVTRTGDLLGTPAYMAPEQMRGAVTAAAPSVDIHALGAILYDLLTGRPPYLGTTPMEIMRQVITCEPLPPSRMVAGVPADLQTICLKCLEKDAGKRYRTAGDIADDLRRFLDDRPILARRTGSIERMFRWSRRNPALAALLGTVVVLLALGLPTVTALYLRARTQATRAEKNFDLAQGAVEKYLSHVGNSPELKFHGLEQLRRSLLLTAKDFFDELENQPGDDRTSLVNLAEAHHRLARISQELGDHATAIEQYLLMRDAAARLVSDEPRNVTNRSFHAGSMQSLGACYLDTGRTAEAELQWTQAREILERLVQESPVAPSHRMQLATTLLDLTRLYAATDRDQEAEACFQRAQENCNTLLKDLAKISRLAASFSHPFANMAAAYANRGMFREAEISYLAARDIDQRLAEEQPLIPERTLDLARDLANLAGLYTSQGRNDEARAAFDQSGQLADELVRKHPLVLEYQEGAAANWQNRGSLEFHSGNWQEAQSAWEEARRQWDALRERQSKVVRYAVSFAQCCSNLGNVAYMRQRYAACEQRYQEAIAVLKSLLHNQPEDVELQELQASIQDNLASSFQARDMYDKAVLLFEDSVRVHRNIVGRQPSVPDYGRRLAGSLINLANIHHKMGDYSAAEKAVRQGCDVARRLAAEHTDTPDYADVLGDALNLLGNVLINADRLSDAETSFREALQVREDLVKKHPDVRPFHVKLGTVSFNLGRVERDADRPDLALGWYDRSLELFQAEWDRQGGIDASETLAIRESLCGAHWEKARALYHLGQIPEALVECDRGLALDTGTQADGLHALRARVLARLVRSAEAVVEADSVAHSESLDAFDLTDLAAAYAQLATQARHDSQASSAYLTQVRQLLQKARKKSPRAAARIEKDPDLSF